MEKAVIDVVNYNIRQQYNYKYKLNLFAAYETGIQNIVFTGIKRGVFEEDKQWQYLFIPAREIHSNSSFAQLAKRFAGNNEVHFCETTISFT